MSLRRKIGNWISGEKVLAPSADICTYNFDGTWNRSANQKVLISKVRGWSFTCIRLNGQAVGQVPLRLYQAKTKQNSPTFRALPLERRKHAVARLKLSERAINGDELVEITDHPMLDLLRHVNPWDTSFELKDLTTRYLNAVGVSYWYKERKGNEIVNIWPLQSQFVTIEKNKTNGIKSYKYGCGENKQTFRPRDIVHFKYASLTDLFKGDAPLEAGEQSVDLNNAMNVFEIASFKNGITPSAIMTIPADSPLSPDEKKRIESKFRRTQGGAGKTGKLVIASGGADIKPWGFSPKEMSYTEGRSTTLEETCGVFGVPVAFVKPTEISRDNLRSSMDLWMNFTVNPTLITIEQKLNEQFTPEWGDDLFLLFDDARPKDAEVRLKEIETLLKTKYSFVNEQREIDGLEPVAWGDEPVEAQVMEQNTDDDKKEAVVVEKQRRGQTNDLPEPDFMPRIFTVTMFELFKRMEAEILKNLRNYGKSFKQDEDDAFAANPDDVVSSIFDSSKWATEISEESAPFVQGLLRMGLIDAAEKVDLAFVSTSSPAVLRAMELRKEQIRTVANTVQAEVRESIAESITMGESRSQAVKRVRDQFDARFKADRVVRTETIWAHNEGTTQAWDQSGVVKGVEWDTVEDDRRCPYCAEMEGKTISKGDVFFEKGDSLTVTSPDSGNPITLKFGFETIKHPPLHPNCRCQLIPIISDD